MLFACFRKTTETTGTAGRTDATAGCHEVTYNRDNGITVACFRKTTETTGTTGRTGATAGCHEVTYNRDNKITSAVIGFVPLFYDNC